MPVGGEVETKWPLHCMLIGPSSMEGSACLASAFAESGCWFRFGAVPCDQRQRTVHRPQKKSERRVSRSLVWTTVHHQRPIWAINRISALSWSPVVHRPLNQVSRHRHDSGGPKRPKAKTMHATTAAALSSLGASVAPLRSQRHIDFDLD
jgi:hypothetical protein